jgi:hypothetical protein
MNKKVTQSNTKSFTMYHKEIDFVALVKLGV